jgi:hypothetical protein
LHGFFFGLLLARSGPCGYAEFYYGIHTGWPTKGMQTKLKGTYEDGMGIILSTFITYYAYNGKYTILLEWADPRDSWSQTCMQISNIINPFSTQQRLTGYYH